MNRTLFLLAALGVAAGAFAGTIVKSKYTADGKATESTIYSSPGRQRVDAGDSRTIQQCDLKRILQFDEKTKTFITVPLTAPAAPPADACTNKPAATDTGERKSILGLMASRWKTVLEGCDGSKTEIDGWYAGLDYVASCEISAAPTSGAPGYPLAYTLTNTGKDGKSTSVTYTVESLQLTNGPLDAALFEVPGEGKETSVQAAAALRNPEFMEATATPKAAGGMRVGVATAGGKGALDASLVKMLKDAKVEAVPLGSGTEAEIQARAAQAQVDYVLTTEVGEVKAGGASKVGGFLSKASSMASGAAERQAYTATVNYKLVPVSGGAPKLAASAVGATAQFGLREAMALGQAASMFMPMGMMMRPGMGGMMPFLTQMGGYGAGGAGYGMSMGMAGMMRGVDPGMMMMAPAVNAAMNVAGNVGGASQEDAVGSAMEKIAKSVATSLKPGQTAAAAAPAKAAKGKKK